MRSPRGAFVSCMLLVLLCGNGFVKAQPQVQDSSSSAQRRRAEQQQRLADSQLRIRDSQRILPLPEGELSDSHTQMQLLKNLRSLIAAADDANRPDTPSPEESSKIDDKQLEQLQQALKKLQDQLPPGIKAPDLESIPKEQLDEAISNPAVQEQLKKMLQQFSRDGLLPKNDNADGHSQLPPIPRRTEQSSKQPRQQLEQPQSPTPPEGQSWQALKDAMKKLSDIAQGGRKMPQQNDGTSPNGNAPVVDDESSPDIPPIRSGDHQPPRADLTDVERNENEPHDEESVPPETPQPSLQAFQDMLERYKNSQRDQPSAGEPGSLQKDDPSQPEVRSDFLPPHTENSGGSTTPNSLKRVLRRPDRTMPVEPPLRSGSRNSEQAEVFPPLSAAPRHIPPVPAGDTEKIDQRSEKQSEGLRESPSSADSIPSVSEFLKEQIRNGFPAPRTNNEARSSNSPGTDKRPGSPPSRDSVSPDTAYPNAPDQTQKTEHSTVDIRSELEKRGIRRTLQKLIENAKEESQARQQNQQESATSQPDSALSPPGIAGIPYAQTKNPDDAGLKKALTDLLGGLDHNMQDIMSDASFKHQSGESPRSRQSAGLQPPRNSDSHRNTWNEAASSFLSDLSKAPQAPASPQSPSSGSSSSSADIPLAAGSFFLVILALLGFAGVVAFVLRRPLFKLVTDATGIAGPKRVFQRGEIRSRADVIAAFHELALNPKQLIESWWTHSAAAKKLATESPQAENAVRTLAEIYEHARYLPDDIELPADRIQSARAALAECQ